MYARTFLEELEEQGESRQRIAAAAMAFWDACFNDKEEARTFLRSGLLQKVSSHKGQEPFRVYAPRAGRSPLSLVLFSHGSGKENEGEPVLEAPPVSPDCAGEIEHCRKSEAER